MSNVETGGAIQPLPVPYAPRVHPDAVRGPVHPDAAPALARAMTR
ncbi:hypothetical protein ACIP3D_33580 [Streptomyces longwoodensis]